MILALDYICFPGKALDFISGWKSFLNFRIFCHLYILVIRNSVSYFQAQEVLASLYVIVVSLAHLFTLVCYYKQWKNLGGSFYTLPKNLFSWVIWFLTCVFHFPCYTGDSVERASFPAASNVFIT